MNDKIWGDYYNRHDFIRSCERVIDSCIKMEKPITFSLEGDWGKGKSWIIKKIEESIKGLDISIDNSEKTLKSNNGKYLVFTYNAWEKDFYEEPLVAILMTIVNQLNDVLLIKNIVDEKRKEIVKQAVQLLEGILSKISKKLLGADVVDAGKKAFKKIKELKKQSEIKLTINGADNIENDIGIVVETLNNLSAKIPIVFIIDELDRCVPDRAIKTLERLHHVFGKIKSSVTIISIYRTQLENSIRLMFGEEISIDKYLSKFINFSINVEQGITNYDQLLDKLKNFKEQFNVDGDDFIVESVLNNVHKNISAREFEKICNNAILCHKIVNKDSSLLSKECFAAEIFLFACKHVEEVEKNRSGFSPECINVCKTPLGKFAREFLVPLQRKPLAKNLSQNIVMFVVSLVYGFSKALVVAEESIDDKDKLAIIREYYDEYRSIFNLMK